MEEIASTTTHGNPITLVKPKSKSKNKLQVSTYSGALTHQWSVNTHLNELRQTTKIVRLPEQQQMEKKPEHAVLGDLFAKTSLHMNLRNTNANNAIPVRLLNVEMVSSRRFYQGPVGHTFEYPGHIEQAEIDISGSVVYIPTRSTTKEAIPQQQQFQQQQAETKFEPVLDSLFKTTAMHMRALEHLKNGGTLPVSLLNSELLSMHRAIQGPLLPFHSKHGHIDIIDVEDFVRDNVSMDGTNGGGTVNVDLNLSILKGMPCKLLHAELVKDRAPHTGRIYQGPLSEPLSRMHRQMTTFTSGEIFPVVYSSASGPVVYVPPLIKR